MNENPINPTGSEGAAEEEKSPVDKEVGDIDDTTGVPIKYIVYAGSEFLVDIDNDLSLNWITSEDYSDYASDFGEVVGSCELSEALVDRIFSKDDDRYAYKKMLGSVIGRILDDKNSASARKLLAIVDERINEHGKERVRMIYIYSALFTLIAVALLLVAVILAHSYLNIGFLDPTRYRIILSILLAGVGAFISTFARFNNYTGSLVAGIRIHRLDGFLRIFYGLIAGLIIFLAVKANVVLGFVENSTANIPWLYYFLAMVAGASEVLIPNLIKQAEGELGIKKLEKKEGEMDAENEDKKKEDLKPPPSRGVDPKDAKPAKDVKLAKDEESAKDVKPAKDAEPARDVEPTKDVNSPADVNPPPEVKP